MRYKAEVVRVIESKSVLEFDADDDKAADKIADDYMTCLNADKPLVGLAETVHWEIEDTNYDLEDIWSDPDPDQDIDNYDNGGPDEDDEDPDELDDEDDEDDLMVL